MPHAYPPPPCRHLGSQCQAIPVTLRASSQLRDARAGDHEATWLLGHTQQIEFGELWHHKRDLFVRAELHVPCKYLRVDGDRAECRAHGFAGPVPAAPPRQPQPRRLDGDHFRLVERGKLEARELIRLKPRRSLTVLGGANPCATANCRTADHTRGAACCRDLQIEIMCDVEWTEQEALVRSRKSPYLCKIVRNDDDSLEVEIISTCGYLGEDGISCGLHGKRRADGRQAKPDLCRRWPVPTTDETLHPGCVFALPKPAAAGV